MSKLSSELLCWIVEGGEGEVTLCADIEKNQVKFAGDLEMNVLRVLNQIESLKIRRVLKFDRGDYTISFTIDAIDIPILDELDCIEKVKMVHYISP